MKIRIRKILSPLIKRPLNMGLAVLFVAVILMIINIFVMGRDERNQIEDDSVVSKEEVVEENSPPDDIRNWEFFIHPEYKFSVYIPRLLIKREYEESGDYLFFVKFEENTFSEEKGVAVGVSDRSLEEEEAKTREIIEQGQTNIEPKRREMEEGGLRLDYEGEEMDETRSLYLINNGEYTYSISTTSEQIDRVISGFVLLE